MKAGRVDLSMESQFLVIGATGDYDVMLPEFGSVGISDRHLAFAVRPQIGFLKVEFWSGVEIRAAHVLYDGEIDLPDGRLQIVDIEGLVNHTRRHGIRGQQRITVAVDEPMTVSRMYVVSGEHADERDGGFEGSWFGAVAPAASQPGHGDLMEYYLADHDSPAGRLSALTHLIAGADRAPRQLDFDVLEIREWLRWLSPQLRIEDCSVAAERVKQFVLTSPGPEECARFSESLVMELAPDR